mgnify:CR=1 FL=1
MTESTRVKVLDIKIGRAACSRSLSPNRSVSPRRRWRIKKTRPLGRVLFSIANIENSFSGHPSVDLMDTKRRGMDHLD